MIVKITGKVAPENEEDMNQALDDGNWRDVTYTPNTFDNMTLVHNHPSGGNFSDGDLQTVATTKARGIIAMSSNSKNSGRAYHFQKNQNFKAKEFVKAMNNAKWPTKYDYDKGADWWLKKNQRAFGYKYSSKKLID